MASARSWAAKTFGHAALGDRRRTKRLVEMTRHVALAPAGRVSEVFHGAKRQAAYDFLEHDEVPVEGVTEALFDATAVASGAEEEVLIVEDGTSLTLTDRSQTKGFGKIGSYSNNARGLKVMNALALTMQGTCIGVADQVWWTRQARARKRGYRRVADRESARWREGVSRVTCRFSKLAPRTKLHFLMDREGDATLLIRDLLQTGQGFTIRSNGTRKVMVGDERVDLRAALGQHRPIARMKVEVPARHGRPARTARMEIRAAKIPLVLRDKYVQERKVVLATVVWAREVDRSGDRLEWLLITSDDVRTATDACDVVERYTFRWRIEDMHRTWKSGLCAVEETQLRSTEAVIKWATILAAVATRAERLKHLSRETPEAAATVELTTDEIAGLVLLRKNDGYKSVSTAGLTLAQAVRWIAEQGGYVHSKANSAPGTTTIGRGLERLAIAAEVLQSLRTAGVLR